MLNPGALKTIKFQGKVKGSIFKDFANSTAYSSKGEFSKDQSISILIQINNQPKLGLRKIMALDKILKHGLYFEPFLKNFFRKVHIS